MKTLTEPLAGWDIVAVVVYFILVLLAGLYSMYKSKRDTVSGYFLAGRHVTWIPVGASLFASNIGSDHFIGLAGSGAAAGIAVGAFELNALALLQLLGWVFLPVYIASRVSTLPEFMSKRFGRDRIRILLATLSLMLYIFTKISVNMYAGALFIKITLGWNLYISIVALLMMTALCTVAGGLTAVIYTDTLQCAIMVIGSIIVCIKAFVEVGGYEGLQEKYSTATASILPANSTCGQPRPDAWTMLRDPVDSDMPWLSFIVGQTPASIWYWCTDQMMVQRALASKSLSHAQGATIFAGYIKLLPLFVMVMPGMISRILYPDIVGCATKEECMRYCDSPSGCSNMAYPLLVFGIMPAGLRGVMLAVMMAALMSDLTSVFNSASTLFTIDIWTHFRTKASTREQLFVGKVFVCVLAAVSILWVPIILQMQGGQLYLYIQAISAYIAPPIAAVYLLAVLWKRMNEQGAFWSLMLGFVVGAIRMGLDFYFVEPVCGELDLRPDIIRKVHYMSYAAIMFWLTIILAVVGSLLTSPPTPEQLFRTTYWTRLDQDFKSDKPSELVSPNSRSSMRSSFKKSRAGGDIIRPCGVEITSFAAPPISYQIRNVAKTGDDNPACDEWISTTENHYNSELDIPMTAEDTEDPVDNPAWKKCWFWFCGYDNSPENERAAAAEAMRAHLDRLSSLEQDRRAVIFLRINLCFILLVAILMYIYFTFWAAPNSTA